MTFFIHGCIKIDTEPKYLWILSSSTVSFLGSLTQTLILHSTQTHGKSTKASFIFTMIGLLSAFCGMLAGGTIWIMDHFHVNENYLDIPDLIVCGIFSTYLVVEAVILFCEAKHKKRSEATTQVVKIK